MIQAEGIKIAFMGCGRIAQAHLRGIQTHAPQLQVTAAIDTNLEAAQDIANQTGARVYSTLQQALNEGDFQAVDIMLPHSLHEQAAIIAFEAGKHVILEKPMATTLLACDRILKAAKETGTVFMVAEQSQYWPEVVTTQQLIQDGIIGEIVTARAAFGGPVERGWSLNSWRYNKEITGGGICIDGGQHWIRPLRMWLGEIDEVIAYLDYPIKEMEGESLAYAIMRFKSGKNAIFEAIRAGHTRVPGDSFRITGTEGTIVIEKGRSGRALLYNDKNKGGKDIIGKTEPRHSAFGLELYDFVQAILYGKPLTAGPEVSLGELRTALAMYRSAASQQWEKVWD
jgi:UDP-N-acetyl-2-amino-2-deoxyglucuronate dehydrogenase